jgi:hypothetical protein
VKNLLTSKNAAIILLLVFAVVFVFHFLILIGLVSSENIWGGNVPQDQLLFFEVIAIVLLSFFSWVIAIKGGIVSWSAPAIVLKIGPWVVFTYLVINTAGNLLSPGIEKLFSIVTFLLATCAFKIATSKNE